MQFQPKGYFSFKNRRPIPVKKSVKFGLILKQILSLLKPGAKVLGKLLYQPKGMKINRGGRIFVITLCVNWAVWVIAEQMRASFPYGYIIGFKHDEIQCTYLYQLSIVFSLLVPGMIGNLTGLWMCFKHRNKQLF